LGHLREEKGSQNSEGSLLDLIESVRGSSLEADQLRKRLRAEKDVVKETRHRGQALLL